MLYDNEYNIAFNAFILINYYEKKVNSQHAMPKLDSAINFYLKTALKRTRQRQYIISV